MSTHHVLPTDLRAWVLGEAGGVVSMSVEQHVVGCAECQAAVAGLMTPEGPATAQLATPDHAATWDAVRDEVELPPVSMLERLLVRIGLPPGDALLTAAAPALRGSWICAVTLSLLFAMGGAISARSGGFTTFLMVAPLVPVLGVAVAFGPEAGPALEQESSAPYPLSRLLLLRTSAVLLTALPVVVVGQWVFPERVAWLWLLPACGFTALVLALSTWFGPWWPATAVVLAWLVGTTAAVRWDTIATVLAPRFLVLYTLMLIIGPIVLVLRARQLGTIGRIPQ